MPENDDDEDWFDKPASDMKVAPVVGNPNLFDVTFIYKIDEDNTKQRTSRLPGAATVKLMKKFNQDITGMEKFEKKSSPPAGNKNMKKD
jgi:hypothetical protein